MEGIIEALGYISPDDYDTWYKVGMALKHEGYDCSLWDDWSRGSAKWKPGACEKKWNSFRETGTDLVTIGTVIQWAKDNGYDPYKSGAMDWDDLFDDNSLGRGYEIIDHEIVKSRAIPEPTREPIADLRRYLNLLFKPDDFVGYCDRLEKIEGEDRYVPKRGIYRRRAGEILAALDKGFDNASLCQSSAGGAMIRFNPLDGEGESDANVTDFRYCLVESDLDGLEKQYGLYLEMRLPIVALVYSGSKSLHAIIRIDAGKDHATYKERVDFVYRFCEKNGLKVDKNDKNASRYSRMPGIEREGKLQYIVAENIGFASFLEWEEWVKTQNDDLPKDQRLDEILSNLRPLKEELISDVLRIGHKMLIAAPSKAGKSFLLMNLAVCIAEGMEWLGHKCKQGRVYYVNLELDEDSCNHRFADIYGKLNIQNPHYENITIWHLRGRAAPLDQLAPFLENRTKGKGYLAVIIDPIYKVITGDENNATEMSRFCGYFDRISTNSKVALIYSHHHSKGATSKYSNAMDRSSGSGVFARDPDAIMDLTELEAEGADSRYREFIHSDAASLTAWEMSGTLREFPPMEPTRLWFDYPVHRLDSENFLATAKYSGRGSGKQGVGKVQRTKEDIGEELEEYFWANALEINDALNAEVVADEMGLSLKSIQNTHAGKKTEFETGTLDGIVALFHRGQEIINFNGKCYRRRPNGQRGWEPVQ